MADLHIVLLLLTVAIILFALDRPRMDVVALMMLVALPFTGVISVTEALAGFSDPNIVLIAALFVIGEGLVATGVARQLGDQIIGKAGNSPVRLLALLMGCVCFLGAFMSSTAVTAIFIPVALRIAQITRTAPGQLMMPLSFAALISGMMTLVATPPNLVINSELVRQGAEGFGFFSFTPFGLPILLLGIVYMTFARRWLGQTLEDQHQAPPRPRMTDWIKTYELGERAHRLRLQHSSPLAGKTLAELDLRGSAGVNIIAIERKGDDLRQPTVTTRLSAGDVLLVDLIREQHDVDALCLRFGLERSWLSGSYFNDRAQVIGMAEVIVPTDSPLVGKSVIEAAFRTRTGLSVIGLRRGPGALDKPIAETRLAAGDTLLVVGTWKHIERIDPDETGVLTLRLPKEIDDVSPVTGKAPHALGTLALVVLLMATSGITGIANVQAALIGCLLMGAFGCLDMTSAYRSISWKTIIVIVGMLPFALALQRTGGVDIAAAWLSTIADTAGPHGVLAALFATTVLMGLFISNTTTAVLMAPIALAVARDMGASLYPFAMIVALAASTAFITPISSPVSTLVVTPGRYTFVDFVRVGGPFALIVMLVSVFLVPVLLPF